MTFCSKMKFCLWLFLNWNICNCLAIFTAVKNKTNWFTNCSTQKEWPCILFRGLVLLSNYALQLIIHGDHYNLFFINWFWGIAIFHKHTYFYIFKFFLNTENKFDFKILKSKCPIILVMKYSYPSKKFIQHRFIRSTISWL